MFVFSILTLAARFSSNNLERIFGAVTFIFRNGYTNYYTKSSESRFKSIEIF